MRSANPPRRDSALWPQIEEICAAVIDMDESSRAAFLEKTCAGDATLRDAVASLLALAPAANRFLEDPALECVGAVVAHSGELLGRVLGPYEIVRWIGAGGMGEVYCARDTALHRDVALKVLPRDVALDPERAQRFKHEAQIVAALNHPNIAAIHGFADDGSLQALVLELVEGATLADIIARGPMPADEAISIARQIAEALEAAHEQGIVHRDLKPSNVAVRADGAVKVLDFGIARVVNAADDALSAPASIGNPAAPAGTLLGTPAYMSPEQAKGLAGDKRTDIWAFGAVLFEMLSGQRAFAGECTHDTLAAVQQGDVEWHGLPPRTPEALRTLIARCLTKDPRQRLRDIGEARIALSDTNPVTGPVPHNPIAPPTARWTRKFVVPAAMATATGAIAATLAWNLKPAAAPPPVRFELAYPDAQVPAAGIGRHFFALSPDGTRIVYTAIPPGLYLRPLSTFMPSLVQGTQGHGRVAEPVFSLDGRSIAFYADGAIRRIAATGGSAVTIAQAAAPYGMNWEPGGLVFGAGHDGIMRVPSDGGTPQVIAHVATGEEAHGPQVLPDGRHLLFTIAKGTSLDRWNAARVVVDTLASGERTTIVDGGTDARYVRSGHLVYARGDTVYAASFDLQRLQVTSAPVAMVNGIGTAYGQTGAAYFAVADAGVLAYQPRPEAATGGREDARLAFIDGKGQIEPLTVPAGAFVSPRIFAGRDACRLRDRRWRRSHHLDLRSITARTGSSAHVWRQQPVPRLERRWIAGNVPVRSGRQSGPLLASRRRFAARREADHTGCGYVARPGVLVSARGRVVVQRRDREGEGSVDAEAS